MDYMPLSVGFVAYRSTAGWAQTNLYVGTTLQLEEIGDR